MGQLFKRLDQEQKALHDSWENIVRLMVVVVVMSIFIWALCSALRWIVHLGTDHFFHYLTVHENELHAPLLLLGVLLAGGFATGALMRLPGWEKTSGDGIDVALDNFHCTYEHEEDDPQPRFDRPAFSLALKKAATTALTLGTGGSGGLEAPVVVAGEAVGAGWGRVFRARTEAELRTYQLSGIAAAVATLLGTPFTAALFAIEIAYGDRIIYRKLAYALLASMVAYVLNKRILGASMLFEAPPHAYDYTVSEYGITALVAVAVSAPIAIGFGRLMQQTGALVARVDPLYRVAVGALGCGLVAVGLWKGLGIAPYHVLGMGEHTLTELLDPSENASALFLLAALVGKMLTTGFTISAGGSAGLLIPSMFLGGVSGALTAKGLEAVGLVAADAETAIFVIVGIASALVAVIGVPMAAIALVLEVFGPAYGPPTALACGVTYVLTLRIKVYGAQRRSPNPDADETGAAPDVRALRPELAPGAPGDDDSGDDDDDGGGGGDENRDDDGGDEDARA
ncbi:chloride channel protein [Haliangium ochraceum]|uniref:Cl-channel voltage-gated family protein n=1 Tax=Haliangium ochraceum (strain DSM 14365 / JCM 11303 / SMP-2) TaxID=502025 RepID=D0LH98_HALO1|nr:chloride channel protein [Haliangium ochraceum]ACY18243.1 Cl- channel voltage-gated family protein [Haliangium ochraceum DSM 14365]